eukprot:TRINITY_DN3363_c0_g1_i2.p1 TRINITY_DN3363_c0_g1~~TRINITY_DN3363_c0_g1_i2.p1  ORF type:complete len:328 (+),score=84.17 TRINITY_DN3363_c0_g1_i2:113-985(+)
MPSKEMRKMADAVHKYYALALDEPWTLHETADWSMDMSGAALTEADWKPLCKELGADPRVGIKPSHLLRGYEQSGGIESDYEKIKAKEAELKRCSIFARALQGKTGGRRARSRSRSRSRSPAGRRSSPARRDPLPRRRDRSYTPESQRRRPPPRQRSRTASPPRRRPPPRGRSRSATPRRAPPPQRSRSRSRSYSRSYTRSRRGSPPRNVGSARVEDAIRRYDLSSSCSGVLRALPTKDAEKLITSVQGSLDSVRNPSTLILVRLPQSMFKWLKDNGWELQNKEWIPPRD